ncbi:MAG: erythromycin esterase family protein [Thermomicrobiales bacterium]
MDRIGDARYVLLGEASHGTHEYYLWRARLSRRLIEERGFSFVAVEGDWPDCFRVHQYVTGQLDAPSAVSVLHEFARWPTWMWANWEVAAFCEWLRVWNLRRAPQHRAGFHGLDVYSLRESLDAIVRYLRQNHPEALEIAYRAFQCFDALGGDDPQDYAVATLMAPQGCEADVLALLREVRRRAAPIDGQAIDDLDAEMNAEVVRGAEAYYRTMIRGGSASWNLRDRHMADTLDRLMAHHGPNAKGIVWAHNTHVGDARQTDMASAGMFNIGQIAREDHADEGVVLVGFGTNAGSVIAGRSWGAPMERLAVPRARPGSWDAELHHLGAGNRMLIFPPHPESSVAMLAPRGQRAIGVVYNPEYERGNYVPTVLPLRYDALLFMDETQALHPLHVEPALESPELYPWNV